MKRGRLERLDEPVRIADRGDVPDDEVRSPPRPEPDEPRFAVDGEARAEVALSLLRAAEHQPAGIVVARVNDEGVCPDELATNAILQ